MEINPTSQAASATSASAASSGQLAETFDTFLTLLTTQLQHQDPLEPLDSNEFTQQLVMFTQAEQTIATNKNLESLLSLLQANTMTDALSYLGTTIEASGSTTALVNGSATWHYELPVNASSVEISVTDQAGTVVATARGDGAKGQHSFVWDGRNAAGVPQPEGLYQISVTAQDAAGGSIAATTSVSGIVDGIELDGGQVILSVGAFSIPHNEISAVKQTPAAPPPQAETTPQTDQPNQEEQKT